MLNFLCPDELHCWSHWHTTSEILPILIILLSAYKSVLLKIFNC